MTVFRISGTTLGGLGLYRVILGLYWDNGKENGNYYLGLRAMEFFREQATQPDS